jgi:hypothetical protein
MGRARVDKCIGVAKVGVKENNNLVWNIGVKLEYWGVKKFVYDLLSPCRIVGNFFQLFPETTPPVQPFQFIPSPPPFVYFSQKRPRKKGVVC